METTQIDTREDKPTCKSLTLLQKFHIVTYLTLCCLIFILFYHLLYYKIVQYT